MNDIIRTLQFEKEQLEARIRLLEDKLESDSRQISEYDHELRQAKRLLKAAVEGYSFIGHITKDYACPSFTSCSACPMDEGKQCKKWEHADEALALTGEEGGNDA